MTDIKLPAIRFVVCILIFLSSLDLVCASAGSGRRQMHRAKLSPDSFCAFPSADSPPASGFTLHEQHFQRSTMKAAVINEMAPHSIYGIRQFNNYLYFTTFARNLSRALGAFLKFGVNFDTSHKYRVIKCAKRRKRVIFSCRIHSLPDDICQLSVFR